MTDVTIREGWKFTCEMCPFADQCECHGAATEQKCEVVDYHHSYVTIKPPMKRALVFRTDTIDEDIIPTEKEAVPKSLLDKAKDRTNKED